MSRIFNVAVIVGSLRKGSFSRLTAKALFALAPRSLRLEIVEIGDLALYDQDVDAEPPPSWITFRERVKAADAVLFVTPEYNRSIPGCLKNAIDVGSRPYGSSVWAGKVGAVMSVSPGAVGAFGANQHLRQCFVFLDVPLMQQPEAYVGGIATAFDESGALTDEAKRSFFEKFMQAFAAWIEKLKA